MSMATSFPRTLHIFNVTCSDAASEKAISVLLVTGLGKFCSSMMCLRIAGPTSARVTTPPVVVRRMVPCSPTAVPVFASVKKTLFRFFVIGIDWCTQCVPPSVVRLIVLVLPTVVPVFALVKETPMSSSISVPLGCLFQFAPPFVVRIKTPNPPTAVPVFASVKQTP